MVVIRGSLCLYALAASVLLTPSLAVRSGVRRLRALEKDPVDDMPYCVYGPRGSHGGHVQVFVQHGNMRALEFDGEGLGTQTMVKCNGDIPQGCAGTERAKSVNDTQACDWAQCPCDVDTSSLQFSYMDKMMEELKPMCEYASVDSFRKDGPFRVLLIGLGGGALPMYTLEHCPKGTRFESVEYDPRVIDVATNFFGLRLQDGIDNVENNDGGAAVQERVKRGDTYDVILVDAFKSGGTVPDSCKDSAFITGTKTLLRPNGKVIQQIWSPQYDKVIEDYKKVYGTDKVKGTDIEMGINHLIIAQAPDA